MQSVNVFAIVLFSALVAGVSVDHSAPAAEEASRPPQTSSQGDLPCAPDIAEIVRNLSVDYPAESHENNIQGLAEVEVTIDTTGRIVDAHPISGPRDFANALVRAANKWTKDPIIEAGFQKPLVLEVEAEFKIDPEQQSYVEFPAIPDTNDVVITMDRGGCYGSCPIYSLKIHGNRLVEYEGGSYVFLRGKHSARISRDEFDQLLRDFQAAGYFSLDEKYIYRRPSEILVHAQGCSNKLRWIHGMTTDLPTTVTSITIGNTTKQVVDYDGAPPQLTLLETQIDQLAHSDRWLRGSAETVAGLRAEGFDLNTRDLNGETAILGASRYSALEIVRDMVSAGANVNVSNSYGHTPLMFAALRGLPVMVTELLKAGADPHARDKDGRTVLMYGCSSGNDLVVNELLKTHPGINQRTKDGNTALMAAAATGNPKVVKLILSAKPRVNDHGHNGATALIAGSIGELEWESMYESSPRPEIPDEIVDRTAVVKMLVSAGANLTAANRDGETALFTLEDDAIKELIKAGIDLNARNHDGDTALGDTVSGSVAKLLVEAGANTELANPEGTTPLMHAAGRNYLDILEVLTQANANVDRQDNKGRTALMYAVEEGLDDPVGILIQAHANVNIKDKQGRTALKLANTGLATSNEDYKISAYKKIIKMLLAAGASVQ